MKARIFEIFTSIQGEGLLLTTPMTFIRFGGCNLRCNYCDEPNALPMESGREMEVEEIAAAARQSAADYGKSVYWASLTGGEPLLQGPAIGLLASTLKSLGFKTYLETSGIFHEALEKVIDEIDLISMDIKLSSTVAGQEWMERHEQFLRVAPGKTTVKIVLTDECTMAELDRAVVMLARFPQIRLVVLQPVTPLYGVNPPNLKQLEKFHELAWKNLPQAVRVMAQMHPIWGLH